MEIDLPEVRRRGAGGVRALRAGAGVERRRRARRDCFATIRAPSATAAARISTAMHEIEAFRAARSPVGLGAHAVEDRDHDLRPRLRGRLDAVSSPDDARQGRPPDADLGALPGGLARRRRACQRDRRAESADYAITARPRAGGDQASERSRGPGSPPAQGRAGG